MAVKDDSTLITKGDLKKFYNKILPYMGGNYVFNTLGTKDYYSEDEKVIGVWTDGKPVYQKTFLGNLPSSDLSIDVSSLNIDTFIESQGMVKDSGDNCVPTPYWNGTTGGPWYHIPYYSSSTSSLKMMFSPSVTYNGRPYIITIKYTKTTDAANSAVDTIGCYDITRPDLWPVEKEITFGNGLYGYRYQQASGSSNTTISIKSGYNPNTFKFINQGGTLIRAQDNAPHCNPSYGGPFWWVQGDGTLSIYTYGGAGAGGGAWKNLDMWCLYTK